MTPRRRAIWAGVVGWSLILTAAAVHQLGDESRIPGYRLHAAFGQIGNLKVGDPVHIGGIRVGRVIDSRLSDNYRPVVTFSLAEDVRLPEDTSASIQTDGLFGSQFLALEPGGSESSLRPGDTLTYTESAIPLSRLLDLIIEQGERHSRAKDGGSQG